MSTKKWPKKQIFLAALFPIEIQTQSPIITLKNAEFLALSRIAVLGIMWPETFNFAIDGCWISGEKIITKGEPYGLGEIH